MTSCGRSPARPQPIEARVKIEIAMRKMSLAPKRSATQPLTGMNMASETR